MQSSGELAWFRAELWRSIVRPRDFARSLVREHYGLAGLLVALIAGIGLSVGVDLLVLVSKGIPATALIGRLVTDATFLSIRLAVSAAAVSWLTIGALRLTGRRRITLDQLFTAITFALAALAFAPIPGAIVAVAATPETLLVGGLLLVALAARVIAGVALNIRAILPPLHAAITFVVVIVLAALVLGDQVSRMRSLVYAVVPALVHDLAATPVSGQRHEMLGFALTLPPGWRNASTGTAGEAARFESSAATVVIARAVASPVDTADSYADNIGRAQRHGATAIWHERAVTRIDGIVAIDDRYGGVYEGRTIVWRQFTIVPGAEGLALVYRAIAPVDAQASLAEAATIAASWHIERVSRWTGLASGERALHDGGLDHRAIGKDPERAKLRLGRAQRDEDIERVGVVRLVTIGRRWERLAHGVAVIDRDQLLAVLVHRAEGAQLLSWIDAIAGHRRGVDIRAWDDTARKARDPGEEPAGLVRRGFARVRDDLIAQLASEREDPRRYAPPAIAGMTMTSAPSGTVAPSPPRALASSSPMYTFT